MGPAQIRRITHCLIAAVFAAQASAAAQAVPEYKLKAAFVYNFALFTDWPPGALAEGGTLNICINPDSALRPALAELTDKLIKGRRIAVLNAAKATDADSLRACHVLFLDSLDRVHWNRIKKGLEVLSILTVSDDGEIGRDGAVIALHLDNNRIGFDIDMRAAKQAKLLLSSKLLRLARAVQ